MTKFSYGALPGAIIFGILSIGGVTACGDDDANASQPTTGVDEVDDENTASYTLFPATGSVSVEGRFEVSMDYIEDGAGRFWIDDSQSGEGQYFDIGLGQSVSYGDWSFEVTALGEDSAQFVATSPDGKVFPE